jgi:hypothetical protein
MLVLVGALGGLLGCGSYRGQPDRFIYSVKFACVPEVGLAEIDGSEVPFEPAVFRTVINVHNFTDRSVSFTKKAVLARSEDLDRGSISGKITEVLGPDQALFVDCLDVAQLLQDQLANQPVPPGDGFVVIESDVELDVAAVYTSKIVEQKQEIRYRIVTEPFKVRVIQENGAGRERLPTPGDPPFEGFHAEVLSVDFEKTFGVLNKVIYSFEKPGWTKQCPGHQDCSGTREILIPAPEPGVPFPDPNGAEDEAKSLEELIRKLDKSLKKIIDVDAVMFQTDEIKQEVTYRWVSDPAKVVVDFQSDVVVDVKSMVEDEDRDGRSNEDPMDGVDNDADGMFDEDPPLRPGQQLEILDTDIAIGVGESEDVEYIRPAVQEFAPDETDPIGVILVVACVVIIVILIIIVLIYWLLTKKRRNQYEKRPSEVA